MTQASPSTRPSVCLVAEMPPPTGGMAVQAERLGANLRAEGHLVVHVPTNALKQKSPLRRVKGLRGAVNLVLFIASLVSGVARVRIVHLFSHSNLSFFLFSLPTALLARLLGRRLVIHYHGGGADEFLQRWSWLALPVLRLGHALIVPSGFLVDVFARYGLPAQAVVNVLELEKFHYALRDPLRAQVLMARHLQPAYNVACGIRAFARVAQQQPQATLTIAGAGPERTALGKLCAELEMADKVRFVGNIDNTQMRLIFDASHIYLNTSRVDNQPVSILEAFACGLPVVSTAVGGIPYMITPEVDGLLAPDDDDATLASHMLRLLSDQALVRRLSEQGRQHVQDYTWPKIYPLLAAIYGTEFRA